MVQVTEDDKNIYIKISKRIDLDLERLYDKNYFFSLGLHVVDDKDKTKKKGGTKPDSIVDVLDKSKNATGYSESVISKTIEGAYDIVSERIEFVIEKTGKESSVQTFVSYLENLKKRSELNPLTTFFNSGVDYIVLENVTNDLCSCLDYIKIRGMQLMEKKKEMIYVINGRFIILSEEVKAFDEKMVTEEVNILKLLSEICDITYSRGEDHFKSFIYGTLLYNKLKGRIQ
jgi:hypothetical protein